MTCGRLNEAPPVILEPSAARAILYRRGEVWSELRTLGDPSGRIWGFTGSPGTRCATTARRPGSIRAVPSIASCRTELTSPGMPARIQITTSGRLSSASRAGTKPISPVPTKWILHCSEQRFLDRLTTGRLPRSMQSLRVSWWTSPGHECGPRRPYIRTGSPDRRVADGRGRRRPVPLPVPRRHDRTLPRLQRTRGRRIGRSCPPARLP